MKLEQRALRFSAGGNALIGTVDVPERALARGLLLLHAGGGCRTGDARQLTLLSRLLAGRGMAVLRFDRSGCGDSGGARSQGPAGGTDTEDLGAAMKEMFTHVPEMKESVILAAGDAAPAAIAYARADARVSGLILLEPAWPGDGCAGARPVEVLLLGTDGMLPPPLRAHGRHVGIAPGCRRGAWRDAVANACASWLTSW